MYRHLFGPVPSRRLGMSLGVDLVPHKICTFDCIYCECGQTTRLTFERKEYVPVREVLEELEHFFSENHDPDYITFSGSGEPTLNSGIFRVIEFIKENSRVPVALLTNGALFSQKRVRDDVVRADLIIPSLDAASYDTFKTINRPASAIEMEAYIRGLEKLRQEFKGRIWLEIFVIPGYNDSQSELTALKKAIHRIRPHRIQLNTLDRPGTIQHIEPASKTDLQRVSSALEWPDTQIIAAFKAEKAPTEFRKDMASAILETVSRRPCTLDDISAILGANTSEIKKHLSFLESKGLIESVRQKRGVFYKRRNR